MYLLINNFILLLLCIYREEAIFYHDLPQDVERAKTCDDLLMIARVNISLVHSIIYMCIEYLRV